MKISLVISLAEPSATLEIAGGKGLSLAKLIRAGLPVPDGFLITTDAYRQFVEKNNLQPRILAEIANTGAADPAALEAASAAIRDLFAAGKIPEEIAVGIAEGYAALSRPDAEGQISVAVRSSATAEDLPEASFAGQQDTFLNVRGDSAVLEAVKQCWASLWTARAIAYRMKNHVDHNSAALAVVVQEMVFAEASGIVFTVNPINGRRDEMVINASWGLGEAVVGGRVTPDTLVIDKATGRVKQARIAEKTVITVMKEEGTEEIALEDNRRTARVLSSGQISTLAGIARRIEDFYGRPEDIEWCLKNGQFFILQARPITTLGEREVPSPVKWKLPKGAYAAMRNNIVELMVDPLSPLFATLGVRAINTSLIRLTNEKFGMQGIMPDRIVIVVNHYAYNNGSVSAAGMARMIFGAGKILRKMLTGAVERWTEHGRPVYHQVVEEWENKDWRGLSSGALLEGVRQLLEAAIDAYGALVSGVIPAAWMTEALFTAVYNRLIRRRGDCTAPIFLLGFDSLPIQADKALYSLAEWTNQEPGLAQYLQKEHTSQLAGLVSGNSSPENAPAGWEEWRRRFQKHLREFGSTIYNLDFMHPLPVDDPVPTIDAFKQYLGGEGRSPYARQQASADRREEAARAVRERIKGLPLKWFDRTLGSAQKYAPLRENGLAEIGLAYPLMRKLLYELGARLAQKQVISRADDIYWLTDDEAQAVAGWIDCGQAVEESFSSRINERKAEHQAAMQITPPLALPQMKVFGFDLMSLKGRRGRGGRGKEIKGVAASPGKVTGTARVLREPGAFQRMKAGEVLVAPITTPAWTPLFAMALGVVTDIGGPLSHGSIVAREYGIPAVLGTGSATRRIQDGQVITVDGTRGVVTIEDR